MSAVLQPGTAAPVQVEHSEGVWHAAWRRFKTDRVGLVSSVIVIAFLLLIAVAALGSEFNLRDADLGGEFPRVAEQVVQRNPHQAAVGLHQHALLYVAMHVAVRLAVAQFRNDGTRELREIDRHAVHIGPSDARKIEHATYIGFEPEQQFRAFLVSFVPPALTILVQYLILRLVVPRAPEAKP